MTTSRRSFLSILSALPFVRFLPGLPKLKEPTRKGSADSRLRPSDVASLQEWLQSEVEIHQKTLPNLSLYQIGLDGRCIYPLYAASGGIASTYIVYFILEGTGRCAQLDRSDLGREGLRWLENGWAICAIEFSPAYDIEEVKGQITAKLNRFLWDLGQASSARHCCCESFRNRRRRDMRARALRADKRLRVTRWSERRPLYHVSFSRIDLGRKNPTL